MSKKKQHLRDAKDVIIAEYNLGISLIPLAKKYGCHPSLMCRLLLDWGVKTRGAKPKGTPPWNKGKAYHAIRGEKNPRWKGGITNLNQQIRHCIEYKNWYRAIFQRDDWTCKLCLKRGGNLEADHHPVLFHKIIKGNKITSYEEAQKCELLWSLDNGRTLCIECHNKTKTSFKRK